MKKPPFKLQLLLIFFALLASPAMLLAADGNTNTPAATPGEPAGPMKFFGPITAIDTKAMTFVVSEQTYAIVAETEMTKDGKKATLADAVAGEPARGSYTKRSDGKLAVTKVRFGKKVGGGKNKKAKETTAPANAKTGDAK